MGIAHFLPALLEPVRNRAVVDVEVLAAVSDIVTTQVQLLRITDLRVREATLAGS